jgi:hypothetical protein
MNTFTLEESGSLFDMVDALLEGWSGLRLYLHQRRAGQPEDPTMEVLLAELLRLNLGTDADVQGVIRRLSGG